MKVMTKDSMELLKECSAGVKMAIGSIDDVLDDVKNETLKAFLMENKKKHEKIGKEADELLNEVMEEGKEPPMMAKMMSKMKTSFKMMTNPTDKEAASLIYEGCDMGIKSLYEYLNYYTEADDGSRRIAHSLIDAEEELKSCLRNFV